MKRIKVDEIEKALTKCISQYVESCDDLSGIFDAVAIDGNTMCASNKGGASKPITLSVVFHKLGVTLTQMGDSDKTIEILASTEILYTFDVSGKVVDFRILFVFSYVYCIAEHDSELESCALCSILAGTLFQMRSIWGFTLCRLASDFLPPANILHCLL